MTKKVVTRSKIIISVIGGHKCDSKVEQMAIELGKNIAKMGLILACGGLSGVMSAVSRGAKLAGGLTVGILPGQNKQDANPYIDIRLPTGIGYARNTIVVSAGEVVVAMPGETGTLSEIGFALNMGKPVIDLGNWDIKGMIKARSVKEAVGIIKRLLKVS